MAVVTGPLMSMDASGAFGGTLVFGKWKGRNVVRQLVTPSNPHTADQEEARNRIRVAGVGQHWANVTAMEYPAATATDEERIKAITPAGFAWNGFLVDSIIGTGGLTYDAAESAWTAITATPQGAWNTAAAALTPAIPSVYQTLAGGGPDGVMSAGNAYFHYVYGLYVMGLAAVPGATPPTYT